MKQNAIFIIWDSSKNNFDDMISDISNIVTISKKIKANISNYHEFICDIYKYNNQTELGIYKANKMCIENRKYYICILKVIFNTNDINDYTLIHNLKRDIRNKYKSKTENYFHDNIIHATDSEEEYDYVAKILQKKLNKSN